MRGGQGTPDVTSMHCTPGGTGTSVTPGTIGTAGPPGRLGTAGAPDAPDVLAVPGWFGRLATRGGAPVAAAAARGISGVSHMDEAGAWTQKPWFWDVISTLPVRRFFTGWFAPL